MCEGGGGTGWDAGDGITIVGCCPSWGGVEQVFILGEVLHALPAPAPQSSTSEMLLRNYQYLTFCEQKKASICDNAPLRLRSPDDAHCM